MQKTTFQIAATHTYTAIILQKFFLSPFAFFAYTIALLFFCILANRSGNFEPFIVLIFLLAAWIHIIYEFSVEYLCNNDRVNLQARNIAKSLSSPMLKNLDAQHSLTLLGLVMAAVQTDRGKFILNELGVSKKEFSEQLQQSMNESNPIEFLIGARAETQKQSIISVDASMILYVYFVQHEQSANILHSAGITLEDFMQILRWEQIHYQWQKRSAWSKRVLQSIGRGWVMGYTDELDSIASDMSEEIRERDPDTVIIQEQDVAKMLHIAGRAQHQNVLILGKSGVGKKALVKNVAYEIRKHEHKHSIPYTRFLRLHTERLIAMTNAPDTLLHQALAKADTAGRFILVIEDLAILLRGAQPNVIAVLLKFLQSQNMALFAIAQPQDYHTLVKAQPQIDAAFEKVQLEDASDDDTMKVLMAHYFVIEEKRHVHVTYKALKSIVQLSKRYIGKGGFPGKAVGVLEDAIISAKKRKDSFVSDEDVRAMVSLKANIDLSALTTSGRQQLLNIEEVLRKEIIGQDPAIKTLVNTLKRAKTDVGTSQRPLGTFLFLGPTGVGKTQTAKVLAKHYFGSTENIIRLDMNEFSSENAVDLILGTTLAGTSDGYLAQRVQDKPSSLILLDEIEKAHPKVLNVFLQILDEGRLIDNLGVSTDFRHSIIIATSNAGVHFMRDHRAMHDGTSILDQKQALLDSIIAAHTFAPEFLNRFDDIVIYESLTAEQTTNVARLMLDDFTAHFQKQRGIAVSIDSEVIEYVGAKGYSPEFGARAMRRTITDVIENYIADYLLRNDVTHGQTIHLTAETLGLRDSG